MKEADGFLYSKALGFRWYTRQEWKIKSKFGWTLEDLHDLWKQ